MSLEHYPEEPERLWSEYLRNVLDKPPCTVNEPIRCALFEIEQHSSLTWIACAGVILPDCHTLVMVSRAGIPARIKLPEAACASFSVGSNHISFPRVD